MADEDVRAYGSVAPLKVGLLNDYPTRSSTEDDTLDTLRLVFEEAVSAGLVDRPIEVVRRDVIGLPNGTYHAVERGYDELVAEGCLVIFGPYVSDNAVPLSAHANRVAKVPNLILSGSEEALGEWTFALNNGSMPEEPVMLAAVMLGDARSRIAIAYEASLIGKEYLAFAEKAYSAAGLKVVATAAIPQVEADKAAVVAELRAAGPDALVHVGFGHGLWGFSDALESAGWDPPRYTTTAFEMAHINAEWMHHLRGWIGLDSYDERNRVGQAFLDRFEARYGRRPAHSMPGLCHDVATVIARGLAAARPLTGEGVKHGIEQVKLVPSASGAPGTFLRFGRYIRQGWLGSDYLIARRVLPDGSGHVFHAAPSDNISRAVSPAETELVRDDDANSPAEAQFRR
nr:ABC transporter substrate-binding protein [Mycolicibacterium komanii]CRL72517.1 amino acid ABC transporter substrate-binding protein [Mycolicibacterium komanii]